jgi:hypothetical protein
MSTMKSLACRVALHSRSRGSARSLLLALALKADETGSCVENNAILGKLAGMARNHVCRAARRLIELGELAVEPEAGPNRVNRYRLLQFCAPEQPVSRAGAQQEPSTPPAPSSLPAEGPVDAIYRMRAAAWEAFDMNGRTWHYSSEEERAAFARSEHGQAFLRATQELAAAAGVTVSQDGHVTPNN